MSVYFTNSDKANEGNDKDIVNIGFPKGVTALIDHGSSNSPADNLQAVLGRFKHKFLEGNHFDEEGNPVVAERQEQDEEKLVSSLKNELDNGGYYIAGGDWNFPLTKTTELNKDGTVKSLGTLDELEKILGDEYQIEVTADAINHAIPTLKIRAGSMYNQQTMKVELIDIALKDLVFKVSKKTDKSAPSIPAILRNKFNQIDATIKTTKKKLEQLEAKGELTEEAIDAVCTENGIRNYQNLGVSMGNDHPNPRSSYYYDEKTDTVFTVVNSMEHQEYDFEKHFKDGKNVNLADANQKYAALRHKVLVELYKILAKRDGIAYEDAELNSKTAKDLGKFIEERKKANETNLVNKDKKKHAALEGAEKEANTILKDDDFRAYFKAMLESKELNDVNDLLLKPFDLKYHEFFEKKIKELLHPKLVASYNDGVAKLFNIFFQGLSPKMPEKGEQAISLNGNGFKPFDVNGNLVPISTIESLQITDIEAGLDGIRALYPTAKFAISIVEGATQPEKCQAIAAKIGKMNKGAENIRGILGTNFFAPPKAKVSEAAPAPDASVTIHM